MMSKVSQDIIKKIEEAQLKIDVFVFGLGDIVVVKVRVTEGDKECLQVYEGVVIAKCNCGLNFVFIVCKILNGVGVECVF
jgi:large subunit ribosomal protein L19